MALVAVLWIVAALSILVIGVSTTVRQQIQLVGLQRDAATGQALGEAANALVLQQLQATRNRPAAATTVTVDYAGLSIQVQLMPLGGLIALNGITPDQMAAVLQFAGGLPAGPARDLAGTVVDWGNGRFQGDPAGAALARAAPRQFEAVEDLMLVPGFDYGLYARVAPCSAPTSTPAPASTPPPPPRRPARARPGQRRRRGSIPGPARRRAARRQHHRLQPPAPRQRRRLAFYRLSARVPLDAGKILTLTQDVALGPEYSPTAPWRLMRTDRQIAQAAR
jgi:general secretion pathway protein K